jgi:hypothetical protein
MEDTAIRTTPFRASYWLLWGYLGFFCGYVVADILRVQMPKRLAISACAATGFLVLYLLVPTVCPRITWDRNKPPTAGQWIGIGVSLLWIGYGVWSWSIEA